MALDFATGVTALQGTDYGSSVAPSFAMQAWINADALAGHVMSLYDSANTLTDYEQFKITSGNLVYEFNDGTAVGSIVTAITTNTWYHALALCKANNNREFWLDGTCVGTSGTAVAPSARNRVILGLFGAGTDYDGRIAETAIWSLNSDFGSGDISAAAAGYTPLQVRLEEAYSYWPLLETGPWSNIMQTVASSLDLFTDGTTPSLHDTHPPVIPYGDAGYGDPYWFLSATLSGVCSITGTNQMQMFGTGALSGVCTFGAIPNMLLLPSALMTGICTVGPANITFAATVWQGSATLTGICSVLGITRLAMSCAATLTGVGALSPAYPTMTFRPVTTIRGQGFLTPALLDQFRYVVNPPLSQASVPVTNQSRFLLTVMTTPVSLAHPYYNMEELYMDYDKKTLSFSEIASPFIGRPTWSPEQNVRLQIDFNDGAGLITYFTGQITRRTHNGVNNDESISYQAEGIQSLANRVSLVNTTGKPEVVFTVGTTVITVVDSTDVTTTFTKTIRNAVIDLFTIMSSSLQANSISVAVDTPTLSFINGDLPETIQLSNQGFYSGLAQLMSHEPGKRVYWDDTIQKWAFPNITEAPIVITQIESSQLESCIYDVSTEGRYTAIRLVADQETGLDDNLITRTQTLETPRGTFSIQQTDVSLTPKWDTTALIQGKWDYWKISQQTQTLTSSGDIYFDSPFYWVFRRWNMPEATLEAWPGTPISFYHRVTRVQGSTTSQRWEKFKAKANFKRKEVIATAPVIQDYSDPWTTADDGQQRVFGPEDVKMTYFPRAFLSGSVVTSVSTAGTPTYSNTQFDSNLLFDEMRYPNTGFRGTAYEMFGVAREFVELVDITEVTTANAIARLAPLMDVVISGDMPYAGDPIRQFMNLQSRVRIQHNSRLTGISTVDAYMMGYRYQFGRPGSNNVQLSTDRSGLVRI